MRVSPGGITALRGASLPAAGTSPPCLRRPQPTPDPLPRLSDRPRLCSLLLSSSSSSAPSSPSPLAGASAFSPSRPAAVTCRSSSSSHRNSGFSPTAPSPSPTFPHIPRDVELVTQVSLDRWPRFAQQALAWGGPASVAVYLPCPPDHPLASAYRAHLTSLADDLRVKMAAAAVAEGRGGTATAAAPLTVSVVHSRRLAREGAAVLPGVVVPPPPLMPPPASSGGSGDGYGGLSYEEDLYPINALRNAALAAAASSHVWLVDGDFIPSVGLREAMLVQPAEQSATAEPARVSSVDVRSGGGGAAGHGGGGLLDLSDSHTRPVMWVVPAFEVVRAGTTAGGGGAPSAASPPAAPAAAAEVPDGEAAEVPRTLEQLATLHGVASGSSGSGGDGNGGGGGGGGSLLSRPFHCGRYPQPVSSIDYERWCEVATRGMGGGRSRDASDGGGGVDPVVDSGWITVPYHEYFEPYGIVRRDQVPLYDERFRGYGLNKVQHAYHLAALGFEFRLLTRHFCVTVPHARSVSYTAVFGTAADPQQRRRVEQLYDGFKQEMYDTYGYRYAPPPPPPS